MGRKTKQDIIDRQKKQLETYEEAIERLQKNYHEVLQKEDDDFRRSPYFVQMEEKMKFWENIGNLSESFVSDAEKRRLKMDDYVKQIYKDNERLTSENADMEYFVGITENYHSAEEWMHVQEEMRQLEAKIVQMQFSIDARDNEISRLLKQVGMYAHKTENVHNARGAGRKKMDKIMQAQIKQFMDLCGKGYSEKQIMDAMEISRSTYFRYKKICSNKNISVINNSEG